MNYRINDVGIFCKFFRSEVLNLTLEEFSEQVGVKVTTISSFENGRSTNLKHLKNYVKLADKEQEQFFRKALPL